MPTPSTIIREMIEDRKYKRENFGVGEEELAEEKILEEALDRIEKETGWISVEERLPTIPDEHYLVCVKNKNKEDGIYIIDFAYFSEGTWHRNNTWEDITHWKELPLRPNK